MHFLHLLLTLSLATATPNPQPGANDFIEDITNLAESAANWGGDFATKIYNDATSLVGAVQTGDTYSSMVSRANDIADAWQTGATESVTQTQTQTQTTDSSDAGPTEEAKTSLAEGLRASGSAVQMGYGAVVLLGVMVAL